jgi:probable addiction module antidote protein
LNDHRTFVVALRTVAEAHGMTRIAKAAGVSREHLRRALRPSGNLKLATVLAILRTAGLRLAVKPGERSMNRRPTP